jgi:CHASE3 domain sensor protein
VKQRRIEILILLFTLVLIVAVATIGSITFGNLKIIEKQSEKIYEPNQTVINLKLLLAELRNSENCVRAYGLYKNEEYLQAYQNSLEQIDKCFDSLYYYQKNDYEAQALLDSTESLVEQKVLLLNKQLTLRDDEKVVNEVNRIKQKLDQLALKKPREKLVPDTVKPEKKRGLFSRLFRGQSSRNKSRSDTVAETSSAKVSIEKIKTEVSKVRQNQSRMFADMNSRAMELNREDKAIWARLMDILNILESRQTQERTSSRSYPV